MAHLTNTNSETFGTLTAGAALTVSHFSLFFNFGGDTDGDGDDELLVYTGSLAVSRTFTAGDPIELPAGSLDINLPAGDLEDAAVKAAWDALIADKTSGLTMVLGRSSLGASGKGDATSQMPAGRGYSNQVIELTTGTGNAPTS